MSQKSYTPKGSNNSLKVSKELKKIKSNVNLDNSRTSFNNSRSFTPKNINNSIRFSDICKNFDN